MDIAIIKYGAGNVRSVVNALKRLGAEPVLTDDKDMIDVPTGWSFLGKERRAVL